MSKNRVVQTYKNNSSFVAPAGVTTVRVSSISKACTFGKNFDSRMSQVFLIDPYGTLYAWGYNANGQLGINSTTLQSSPVAVLGGLTFTKTKGTSGWGTTFGITNTGALYSWGSNSNGVLGDNTIVAKSSPVPVVGGLKFKDVYGDASSYFGITLGGTAYSWGTNNTGQLGVNDTSMRSSPTAVVGGLTFQKISFNGLESATAIGLDFSGNLYGWGGNGQGSIGDGTLVAKSSPVLVIGGLNFIDCMTNNSTGASTSSYGLTSLGAIYAWGDNSNGQLGIGNTTAQSSPAAVAGGLKFAAMWTSHHGSVFAMTPTGQMYAWGDNTDGQLGDGTTVAKSSPVAVLGGLSFIDFIYGYSNNTTCYGLTASGDVYAWGNGAQGSLGDGTNVSKSSPVQVVGGLKFTDIYTQYSSPGIVAAFGVTAEGYVYGWGSNGGGQLGDGSLTNRNSPVAISGALRIIGATSPAIVTRNISVTPGSTYSISVNNFQSYFGTTPLGQSASYVVVEYYQ